MMDIVHKFEQWESNKRERCWSATFKKHFSFLIFIYIFKWVEMIIACAKKQQFRHYLISGWQRIARCNSHLMYISWKLDVRPSNCNDVLLNMWNYCEMMHGRNDGWMKEDDNGNDRDAVGWWQKHRIWLHTVFQLTNQLYTVESVYANTSIN